MTDTASLFADPLPAAPAAPAPAVIEASSPVSAGYRVLARKYRPQRFTELVGQDGLVRTLTNALQTGRISQAYMLTGVRGVGKTTTARIIARCLNCTGPDGQGGPTAAPCLACDQCRRIGDDRHVDVIEMDAASRSKVEEMRETLDGVRYGPVSARTKVYIIDEVHMLSDKAFNALLKTLEEPPTHTKFIFATTEIRKVPVTILSRCQRFDLPRVAAPTLAEYYASIAQREGVAAEPAALQLIARAADGSVRDGLSLLDQAIVHCAGPITAPAVRGMLGLADRTAVAELLRDMLQGQPAAALARFGDLIHLGADGLQLLQDLSELLHGLTRTLVLPDTQDARLPDAMQQELSALAQTVGIPGLSRAFQIILRGLAEIQGAPNPDQAAEMVLIRLCHAASLPPPGELLRLLGQEDSAAGAAGPAGGEGGGGPRARRGLQVVAVGNTARQLSVAAPLPAADALPADFAAAVALFAERREAMLYADLYQRAHLVAYAPGSISLRFDPPVETKVPGRIAQLLQEWTRQRWVVSLSNEPGQPTLAEQQQAAALAEQQTLLQHPLVKAALQQWPGARLAGVSQRPQVDVFIPASDDGLTIFDEDEG